MGTVSTSAAGLATGYSNQRREDRCSNGVLWSLVLSATGSASTLLAQYSLDGGTTWAGAANVVPTVTASVITYTQDASLKIDEDDYAHVVYKDPSSSGILYYVRGTPNAARTAYTWSSPVVVESISTAYDYPDITAHRDPVTTGAWVAHIVYTLNGGTATAKCMYRRVSITATGAVTISGATQVNANLAATNTTPSFPQIDHRHTGDGKTVATVAGAAQPDLFISWHNGPAGAGYGLRMVKATYAAGAWTFGPDREIDNTLSIDGAAEFWWRGFFDGTRFVMAGQLSGPSNPVIFVHDRDAADATTTTRTLLTTGAGSRLDWGSASWDAAGNVYLFGVDATVAAGSRNIGYYVFTRAAGTLGARQTIATTGNSAPYLNARRGNTGQRLDYVYTTGSTSPYTVLSGSVTLNQAPTAPTQQTPLDNATVDSSQPITVTFTHQDPDGDPATAWDLRYRVAGTTGPWTTISGTTTAANGATVTATVPANTWGGVVEHQERTYDPSNTAGAWSPSRTVLALPAVTAAQTGGQGGTSASALQLYAITQAERSLRAQSLV